MGKEREKGQEVISFDWKVRHGFDAERPAFIHLVIKQTSNPAIRRMPFQVLGHSMTASELVFSCVYSVTQSCPTLCDPLDCSPPGSSVHEVFQSRVLDWVAISSSKGSSQPRDQTKIFCTPLIAGRFFTTELSWKPLYSRGQMKIAQ